MWPTGSHLAKTHGHTLPSGEIAITPSAQRPQSCSALDCWSPHPTPDLAQPVEADFGHAEGFQLGTGLFHSPPILNFDEPHAQRDRPT
jgi:hypothetical protein